MSLIENNRLKKILIMTVSLALITIIIAGSLVGEKSEEKTFVPHTTQKATKDALPKGLKLPKESLLINTVGDVLIFDSETVRILYLKEADRFEIHIYGSPFSGARVEAEKIFLDVLGLSRSKACRLNVTLNTLRFANPKEAGKVYRLSFCEERQGWKQEKVLFKS